MQKIWLMLTLPGLILLSGCARQQDRAVATACPLPPLIPAAVRTLPTEASLDFEALILELASGTRL